MNARRGATRGRPALGRGVARFAALARGAAGAAARRPAGVAAVVAVVAVVVALGATPTAVAAASTAGLDLPAQTGRVSYYADAFHGRRTASGSVHHGAEMTMAHPRWPFGLYVRIVHLRSGRSVVVRVDDRGPHTGRRIADLSRRAAQRLGILHEGVARVRLEPLGMARRVDDDDGGDLGEAAAAAITCPTAPCPRPP